MKIDKELNINTSAEYVWKILSEDFDKVGDWITAVPISRKISGNHCAGDATMEGRVCHFDTKENGARANERIIKHDSAKMEMTVEVIPVDAPFPVHKNIVDIKVIPLGPQLCKTVWHSEADLKWMGKAMYPMVKFGIGKLFGEIVEELKYFAEHGTPHPRKIKQMKKQGLLASQAA